MEKPVIQRGETVARIFKLVDTCGQCGLTFRVASAKIVSDVFNRYSEELRRVLDRFRFELLSEIRRVDGGDFGPARTYIEPSADAEFLRARCHSALRDLLRDYDEAFTRVAPAHARAMIKRHARLIRQMLARFDDLDKVSA
ncbi:MAG: hypothetical protein HY646_09135 [Acidobacteria bacterium]|nr:hypothetical protein [Acidobacteriota bacterium]